MPSHKEFYDAISNISVNADTLNLNTDQVESKLDTANGILTTTAADIAEIRSSSIITNSGEYAVGVAGGYLGGLRDGNGDTFGVDRNFPVEIQNPVTTGYDAANDSWHGLPLTEGHASVLVAFSGEGTPVETRNKSGASSSVFSFSATTSTSIYSINVLRRMFSIYCEVGTLYVLLGSGTVTTTNYSVKMSAGDMYHCNFYCGAVKAIFASSGSKAYFTEITD